MEFSKAQRRLVLFSALAIAIIASISGDGGQPLARVEEKPVTASKVATSDAKSAANIDATLAVIPERLQPRAVGENLENAFVPRSWAPLPPPPPPSPPKLVPQSKITLAPPPPTKPTAPSLPYKYAGRLEQEGTTILFLAAGERNFAVKPGETIDGSYRLDRLENGTITFTYLPLQQTQTLSIGQPN